MTGSSPLARNAATTPVSTSPVPAVASEGGPVSQTTGPPVGACTIVPAPFSSDDGAVALGARPRRLEPVGVDPGRVAVEQAGELAGMRRQHGRVGALDRLEAEEGVGIDDDRNLEALEQPRHERVRLGAAAEPRPERDGVGALCLGHDRLLGVVPVEAALDGLERQHLDRREALARHGDGDVARVGAKRGHRGEHRRARRPGRAADDEHRSRR